MSAISDAANAALVVEPTAPAAVAAPAAPVAAAPSPIPASEPVSAPEPSPAPAAPATSSAAEKARAAIEGLLEPKVKPAPAIEKPTKLDKEWLASLPKEISDKLIQSKPEAWRVHEAKTAKLEAKIRELESKPNPTAADDSRLKALEKQLADRDGETKSLKQRLAERDYRESDEYQANYVKPFQNSFLKAREFTTRLQVLPVTNADGEQVSPARQATPADFDKVFNAGPQERYAIAKELFGPDMAVGIVRRAEDLDGLNEKAIEAIGSHASNYEKIHAEREGNTKKEQETFSRLKDDNRKALEEKYAEHFSPEFYKDQPELQKALQDGYAAYDNMLADYAKATPEDRAANEVVARAYYAAFPLMFRQNTALKTQVASLQEELKKYQASDPGSITPVGGTAPAAEADGGGIAGAVKVYQPR